MKEIKECPLAREQDGICLASDQPCLETDTCICKAARSGYTNGCIDTESQGSLLSRENLMAELESGNGQLVRVLVVHPDGTRAKGFATHLPNSDDPLLDRIWLAVGKVACPQPLSEFEKREDKIYQYSRCGRRPNLSNI